MTAHPLLLKGFEVELFTGRSNGANVGVAPDVARDLPGFVTEPDRRNLEYVTDPIRDYAELPEALPDISGSLTLLLRVPGEAGDE